MRPLQFLPVALVCAGAPLAAQVKPDSGAFVTRLGNDTIALERFVRTPTHLQVEALTRVPQTRLLYLTVDWDTAGRLTGYQMIDAPAPGSGGPARIRTTATARGDSLRIEVVQGRNTPRVRQLLLGADVPLISPLYSLYDVAIARAHGAPRISMQAQQAALAYSTRWNGDSLTLQPLSGGPIHIRLDARGLMTALDGSETTFKVLVQATAWPEIEETARHFAQQDARGRPMGTLSPRGTARAAVSGAVVSIDYGRPAARGRVIFGNVVPWDHIWRTGANAATQLESTRDLVIGNVTVPAGSYTLWTLPSRRGWQLVINKQTGQWGTTYDREQDLARVPIETRQVRDPEERFIIEIEPQGYGGVIRMTWDRTHAMVPFSVR